MPFRTAIYSDISIRWGVVGYAVAIRSETGITWYEGLLPSLPTNTTAAELAATSIGLTMCPVSEIVAAHSDLNELPRMMGRHSGSYKAHLLPILETMKYLAKRHGSVLWFNVSRVDEVYRECHCRARIIAKRQAVQLGLLGLKPLQDQAAKAAYVQSLMDQYGPHKESA